MDLSTLIGLAAGVLLMAWAMMTGGSILDFIDLPSVAITLGGTVAATMIHFPLPRLRETARIVRHVLRDRQEELPELIQTMVTYAERARREGLLALEQDAENAPDPFLRKGLGLIVDGTDPKAVEAILELDLDALEARHKLGAQLFETMASYAPAFGLVGTLIGLVRMLKGLSDAGQVGPGMAVALLTTLYGALLANLVLLPIAGKLKVRSGEELLHKQVMLEGILAIQAGDSPSILLEKLNSFRSPSSRVGRREATLADEEE